MAIKLKESVPDQISFFRRNLQDSKSRISVTDIYPLPGDSFEDIPLIEFEEISKEEERTLQVAFEKLDISNNLPHETKIRKLLVLVGQKTKRTVGIRAQYVEDKGYWTSLGRTVGFAAKATEWFCRIVFGMGLAVVSRKYRRTVVFGISSAMALQSGLQIVPFINGHFGGAVDQFLAGVTQTTQTFFGTNIDYSSINPSFFTRSTGL